MAPRLHMDAVLTPHRSLPRSGLIVLLAILAAYNAAAALLFFAIGAKPVPIFLGLDFLAVLIAFHASYRQARRRERVQVSADEITVWQEIGDRRRALWRSPTAFTRITVQDREAPEVRVTLALYRRRLTVGARIGPQQRAAFADALEAAVRSARAERY